MALTTQSTTILDYGYIDDFVFIFSSSGVDIYKVSNTEFKRVGYASLPNVTSGDVNESGIWFGTQSQGVYFCPFGVGDLSSKIVLYYATTGTPYTIQSNNINHVSGYGRSLLLTHDVGVDFFPSNGTSFIYSDLDGCDSCAINDTYIAYTVNSGILTIARPTSDWIYTDATLLTTGTTPAISSNTVNHMMYGASNNLFLATGAGIDVYNYSSVVNLTAGNTKYLWTNSLSTSTTGDVAYIDSNDDAIIYNIDVPEIVKTKTGTYTKTWIDTHLALYDAEVEYHAFINQISPAPSARGVSRSWSLYFEIGDTINGIASVAVKINGSTVSATLSSKDSDFNADFNADFGGSTFFVTYTPVSASGYRKTVTVEITGEDTKGFTFTETFSFTTETALSENPSATKPPNVIIYKDLSLTEAEDLYNSVNVNWQDENISQFFVEESQARATGQVLVENNIYHKTVLTLRVYDQDVNSNNTLDVQRGDIMLFDCASLSLTNQKCEVLSKQRVVSGDRIEYNLQVAYYELWS